MEKARNVIFFLGDGMGVSSVTGARILRAQAMGERYSQSSKLRMEKFPYTGLVKVSISASLLLGPRAQHGCTMSSYTF